MRFVYTVILLFIVFVSSLDAKSYIKLTTTTSKYEALSLRKKLHNLGYQVILKRIMDKRYSIYLGPFEKESRAKSALKRLKIYFPKSFLWIPKQTTTKVRVKEQTKKKIFALNMNIGYSSFPSTHIIQEGSVVITQPKTDGLSQSLGLHYFWTEQTIVGFSLMRMSSSDLLFTNLYISLDYQFQKLVQNYFPYFGILGGYSLLKWNIDPIENSETSNNDSQSLFYGTHVGIKHTLSSNWDIIFDYQCIFMKHTTNLQIDANNRSKLQHNISHTFSLGFVYNF